MTYERYQSGASSAAHGATSSREIKSDVLEIRQEISKTMDEISSKLAPKELLSELMTSVSTGGGARFLKNLSGSIERHPIPVMMVAGGLGYILYQESQRGDADAPRGRDLPATHGAGHSSGAESRGSASTAQALAVATRARGDEVAGRARQEARGITQRAASVTDRAVRGTRDVAHRGQELIHEHPLVLLGLGLALGAAVAGTARVTRIERELAGETSDQLMEEVQQRARQIRDQDADRASARRES